MLIKNFQAGSIQDALDLVRREFGKQAVILKTDIIKDNGRRMFSVTAAKDYDQGAHISKQLPPPIDSKIPAVSQFSPQPIASNRLESAILDVMLPELLIGEVKRHYLALRTNDVESDLALRICKELQSRKSINREELAKIITENISRRAEFPDKEKNIVFVGPCGSGKSSLLAKFATEFVFNRKRAVNLSTLDNFRPGAEQEITSLTEILDFVEESRDAKKKNARHQLIDTSGFVPGDEEEFATLTRDLEKIADRYTILVLSLTTSWKNNRRFIEYARPLNVNAIAFTQLDAALSCGAILNVAAGEHPPIIATSDSRHPTAGLTGFDIEKHLSKLIGDDHD